MSDVVSHIFVKIRDKTRQDKTQTKSELRDCDLTIRYANIQCIR